VGSSESISLASVTDDSACCELLALYLSLNVTTPAFDNTIVSLCSGAEPDDVRCRQEFSTIVQTAPFLLRFDGDRSDATAPSSFEEQCELQAPKTPCELTAASSASFTFDTTESCCSLVGGYVSAIEENPEALPSQSLTQLLCTDASCLDDFSVSYVSDPPSDVSFPAPPSTTACNEVEEDLSATCEPLGTNAPITGVSTACCSAVAYFREVYVESMDPQDAALAGHLNTICNERGCRDGYASVLGTDILAETCDTDAEEPTPNPDNSCEYASYCVGEFCYPALPYLDGTECLSPTGAVGRCFEGVCATIPRCAKYDGGDTYAGGEGGICQLFGLELGTLVYVKPSPLSYFTAEEDEAYRTSYGLRTLDSLMQTHLAISQHTFYECQLPHLVFACSATYPRCNIVDNELGDIVDFDEALHGHLVTQQGSGNVPTRRLQSLESRYAAVPGPTCEETCEHRNSFCELSDRFLQQVMNSPPVTPRCVDARYGDDGTSATSFEFNEQFNGQRVYPSEGNESLVLDLPLRGYATEDERESQVADLLGGGDVSNSTLNLFCHPVQNLDEFAAGEGSGSGVQAGLLVCPTPYLPHPSPGLGDVPCVLPCVLPLYSTAETRQMWLAYVVPGTMGMLLCMVHLITLFFKPKKDRKKEPIFTFVYCFLGVLFGLVDTIPVIALYTDLPCEGDTILNKGDGVACTFNRVSICLLLSVSLSALFSTHPTCFGLSLRG
jgi:hypothetical protein